MSRSLPLVEINMVTKTLVNDIYIGVIVTMATNTFVKEIYID